MVFLKLQIFLKFNLDIIIRTIHNFQCSCRILILMCIQFILIKIKYNLFLILYLGKLLLGKDDRYTFIYYKTLINLEYTKKWSRHRDKYTIRTVGF